MEHRAGVGREVERPAEATRGRLLHGGLDQIQRLGLLAAPGRERHRRIGNGRVPGRLGDQAIFLDQPCRDHQLAGEKVGSGEEVERGLQVHERARVPGDLNLASGQGMPGCVVPDLEGDHAAGSRTGQPQPATRLGGADVQRENPLEGPGQHCRGRSVSLREPDRERVEQDVNRPRRVGTRGRGAGGLGRLLQAAGAVQVGGPHRGPERLQVRLARQADVERLQAPGCAQEQPGTVADTALVISDLPAQALQLGGLQRVQLPGLDNDQQPQCRVQRADVTLRPGRREQAPCTASGFGCQHRRTLEERGRRGQAPARLRPARRALQLLGDVLVGPRRGVGPVPGAAVRIDLWISGLRQGAVHVLPLLKRCRPVGRRAHQRMPEPDPSAELH